MRRRLLPLLLLPLLLLGGCRPGASWSPDSRRLAMDPRGLLLTYDLGTRQFKQLTQGPDRVLAPVWSADGTKLYHYRASFKNNRIIAMDVATSDPAAGGTQPVVPDIKPPLARPENGGVNLNIIAGGDQNALDLMREVLTLAPSPNGQYLLYSVFEKEKTELWVARADGTGARRLVRGPGNVFHAAWSPDGARIAYYRSDEEPEGGQPADGPANRAALEVINADGTGLRRLWETGGPAGTLATLGPLPLWTADGRALRVFVDQGQKPGQVFPERSEVWQVPLEGGKPTKYADFPAPSPFLSVSAGGAAFFFSPKNPDEQEPMLGFAPPDLKSGRELGRLTSQMFGAQQGAEVESIPVPAISPDGSRIAVTFLPKGSKPVLLLQGTAPGSKPERVDLPLPIVAAPGGGAQKKPAPATKPAPKPAPKKPTPKKPAPKR